MSFIILAYQGLHRSTFESLPELFAPPMAVLGYTTDTGLTQVWRNSLHGIDWCHYRICGGMFMGSEMMEFIISIAGVLIFTGLTAYDGNKN